MQILLLSLIRLYKLCVSPWLGTRCRFTPGCADYAAEAVMKHGAFKGGMLASKRICRCHPLGGHGFDPVPPL